MGQKETQREYVHVSQMYVSEKHNQPRDVIEDYYDAGLDKATYVDPDRCTIERNRLVR